MRKSKDDRELDGMQDNSWKDASQLVFKKVIISDDRQTNEVEEHKWVAVTLMKSQDQIVQTGHIV